jgi:hypothetical protein
MCAAADLPVYFGVDVGGAVVIWFFLGQSRLKCPDSLHLKHLPSFMRHVRSSIVMRLMSMALGSSF